VTHSDPSRAAALARLQAFVPFAGTRYARERNYDRGSDRHHGVSGLSPYLRHRLITESEVLAATVAQHGARAEKFVQEVFWRTYFKGHLEHKPLLWHRYRAELGLALGTLADDEMARVRLEAAVAGETDIEPFNQWAQELVTTGYLHNHARMWFASLWIFTLKLPWTLGADLFMQHLLDGDPASNTLSWRWVAGLHTKGKHYLARPDNIARYTDGRFSSVRGINELAAPLEEAVLDDALLAQRASGASSSPENLDETELSGFGPGDGLLLHEEDLHQQSLARELQALPCAVLPFVDGRASVAASPQVTAHVQGALEDAAERYGATRLTAADPAATLAWAEAAQLHRIIAPYAPVGPVADQLALINGALGAQGIELVTVRRHYDASCWPHCRKGFFALKKQIPQLLDSVVLAQGNG
jgi:deoxyribodipyrimidine photo-lyase